MDVLVKNLSIVKWINLHLQEWSFAETSTSLLFLIMLSLPMFTLEQMWFSIFKKVSTHWILCEPHHSHLHPHFLFNILNQFLPIHRRFSCTSGCRVASFHPSCLGVKTRISQDRTKRQQPAALAPRTLNRQFRVFRFAWCSYFCTAEGLKRPRRTSKLLMCINYYGCINLDRWRCLSPLSFI